CTACFLSMCYSLSLHDALPICVFALGEKLRIDLCQEFLGGGLRLHGRTVVDEMLNRDALGQFRHAAEVIAVPMRGDQVIDLGERSEEHTSELQSLRHLVCRLLL